MPDGAPWLSEVVDAVMTPEGQPIPLFTVPIVGEGLEFAVEEVKFSAELRGEARCFIRLNRIYERDPKKTYTAREFPSFPGRPSFRGDFQVVTDEQARQHPWLIPTAW